MPKYFIALAARKDLKYLKLLLLYKRNNQLSSVKAFYMTSYIQVKKMTRVEPTKSSTIPQKIRDEFMP